MSSLQGLRSHDKIELPMTGPSPATVRAMLVGVGLGGLGLGALVVWTALHRAPSPPPVTTVGLFGDPNPVAPANPTPSDAAIPNSQAPHPVRGGRVPPSRPSTPGLPAPESPPANPSTPGVPAAESSEDPSAPGVPAPGSPPATTADRVPDEAAATVPSVHDAGRSAPTETAAVPGDPPGLHEHIPGTPSNGGFRPGDATDATGHMDPAAFRFVYQHYHSQIASCYANASRNDPRAGVIVVRVRVGEDGHVRNTRVISDSVHDATLTRCVQTSIQSWRYPQPEGGDVEVDYPLRFGSSG